MTISRRDRTKNTLALQTLVELSVVDGFAVVIEVMVPGLVLDWLACGLMGDDEAVELVTGAVGQGPGVHVRVARMVKLSLGRVPLYEICSSSPEVEVLRVT